MDLKNDDPNFQVIFSDYEGAYLSVVVKYLLAIAISSNIRVGAYQYLLTILKVTIERH